VDGRCSVPISNQLFHLRKKADADDNIPAIIPNELSSKEFRQNWARLIQKVYEFDPLICPKCQGPMRIISFIEEIEIIKNLIIFDLLKKTQTIFIPPHNACVLFQECFDLTGHQHNMFYRCPVRCIYQLFNNCSYFS
jgi:hypothetical protein